MKRMDGVLIMDDGPVREFSTRVLFGEVPDRACGALGNIATWSKWLSDAMLGPICPECPRAYPFFCV